MLTARIHQADRVIARHHPSHRQPLQCVCSRELPCSHEQAWRWYREQAYEQLAALPPVGRATVTPVQQQPWIEGEIAIPPQDGR